MSKKNLIGLTREDLTAELSAIDEKPFRAKQIWHWMYHRGITDFGAMSNLGKPLRQKLEAGYEVRRPTVITEQRSEDGTRKWLLGTADNNAVESVFIPEDDRGALCISSQVGCTLTCSFCHTGTQQLVRNLTADEIVGQMMVARDTYGEWPSPKEGRMLSNIVMMGMGEPLYNYEEVAKAIHILMDGEGLSVSKRRITLSTSGVVPLIEKVGEELGVGLAISLHAVRDDLRDDLVPINRKHPIKELLAACRNYPGANNARRITFEYVMLKGVNDAAADAKELARLLKDIPAKINLIPFNAWPGAAYECSSHHTIKKFSEILNERGLSAPIRVPRGRDIMAACGQLKSARERKRKN
jgi:23S rRNA (adenine2503-C2)-methyltransferase